jgi:hypothetical protein
MKNNLRKISVGILAIGLFAACASFDRQVSHGDQPADVNRSALEKRPFQEKKFDAAQWRAGDAQTRGEMSKDLHWRQSAPEGYLLDDKNRAQVLEILGEPDRKTRGRCCGAGGTSEEEVWLYKLETKAGSEIKSEHLQLYFTDSGRVDEMRIAAWDDTKPDYFPRVG